MPSELPVADSRLHWISVAKSNVNKCLSQLSLEYAQVGQPKTGGSIITQLVGKCRKESFTSSRKSKSTFGENPEAKHRFTDVNFTKYGVE